MKLSEELQAALAKIAPEWEWACQEDNTASPDLISPTRIKVSATNKITGTRSVPIQVSGYPAGNVPEMARFVCQILMIDVKAVEQPLLLEQSPP